MKSIRTLAWGKIIPQAILAGLVGGVLIDAYLWATTVEPTHGSMLALWQWVASTVIGRVAFTSPSFAWLGLLMHFITAMVWAGGYAYLATTRPYMNRQWWISGLLFGFVVFVFMQIVLLAANQFTWPSNPLAFADLIVAHMVFYGLPVAYVVAVLDRSRA